MQTINDNPTMIPMQFMDYKKTSDKNLITIIKKLNILRYLSYKGQASNKSYVASYTDLENKLQKIMNTNKMVGFAIAKSARRDVVSLFTLDYNYINEPLELVYCELQKGIIYVQKTQDYMKMIESKHIDI